MSESSKAPSLGDIVSAAGFVIALITAWLYVAGWSYAYDYFDRFRIPLLLSEIPREHLFIYGGLTLWQNLRATAAIASIALIVTTLAISFRRHLGRSGVTLIAVVSVVLLFVIARLAGISTASADADEQRHSDFGAYPRVTVDLTDALADDPLETLLTKGCARLVLATSDRLFLIVPRRNAPALELNTTVVAWKNVRSMTVSGLYRSCD